MPVIRKLLFLDPFPELDSQVRHTSEDINFVENALDAASTLPSYQTIREDIERLIDYNRTVHAAQLLAREIEEESPGLARAYVAGGNPEAYQKRTLSNLEGQFGSCYRTYHRLRVSAVTVELATLVTRLFGLNERSDDLFAIRMLIHAWRADNYSSDGLAGKRLETFFLLQYDMGFRFRRAEYTLGRIDALLSALATTDAASDSRLIALLLMALPEETATAAAERLRAGKEAAIGELYRLRDQIEFVKWKLATECERIQIGSSRGGLDERTNQRRNILIQALADTQLTPHDLAWILTPVGDDECQQRANTLYADSSRPVKRNIARSADLLATWYAEILGTLSADFTDSVHRTPDFIGSPAGIVNEFVWIHYEYFDMRDMQVFTVMQDQLSGEGSAVEIYRISPLDATLLRTALDPGGENKLTGGALDAFGAFLSREFRQNDMMWGRLDGAERVISAMLPDQADDAARRQLCEKAFGIIIDEEFTGGKCSDLIRPLMNYLRQRINPAGKTADEFLNEALRDSEENCPAVVRQLLQSISAGTDRLAVFRAYYVKPADPPIGESLDRLRRAIRIFGDMLKELDGGNGPFTSVGGAIARFGSALTRFAEFCIPQSMANVFFRYSLQVVYAVALILIVIGAVFYKEVETAGWIVLGMTAAVQHCRMDGGEMAGVPPEDGPKDRRSAGGDRCSAGGFRYAAGAVRMRTAVWRLESAAACHRKPDGHCV